MKRSDAIKKIAAATGAPAADIPAALTGYGFPTLAEMASEAWLGGGSQKNMLATAQFLKDNKRIDTTLDDYSKYVNASYLAAAMK